MIYPSVASLLCHRPLLLLSDHLGNPFATWLHCCNKRDDCVAIYLPLHLIDAVASSLCEFTLISICYCPLVSKMIG